MEYQEFKNSAYRHLYVCEKILSEIDSSKTHKAEEKNFIDEIYYIGGYVIETLLSYSLCAQLRVRGDVLKSDHFSSKKFKTHDLRQKYNYAKCSCCLNDMIFFAKKCPNKTVQTIVDKWDVKYRYEHDPNITLDTIKIFVKELRNIYTYIQSKYPT